MVSIYSARLCVLLREVRETQEEMGISALTRCRRHCTYNNSEQKNEEYNKNNRFARQCSIVTSPVSSTPRRSRYFCSYGILIGLFRLGGLFSHYRPRDIL